MLHAALLVTLGFLVRVTIAVRNWSRPAAGGSYWPKSQMVKLSTSASQLLQLAVRPNPNNQRIHHDALPTSDNLPVELEGSLPQLPAASSGSDAGVNLPQADAMATGGGLPMRGSIGGDQAKTSIFGAEESAASSSTSSTARQAWMATGVVPCVQPRVS